MFDDMFLDLPEMSEQNSGPGDPPTKKKPAKQQEPAPINLYSPQVQIQYGTNSPGANMPAPDKGVPLSDANSQWLSGLQKRMDENDLEYATTLFTTLNTLPLINNKPIQLSELSTVMADPQKKKLIMQQADVLDDNPELDPDTKWKMIENHYKNVMLSGLVLEGNKRFNEDLYGAAVVRDAQKEGTPFTFSSLFDNKKQFISEQQWEINQVNKLTEDYNNKVISYNVRNYKPSSITQMFYDARRKEKGFRSLLDEGSKPMVPVNLPGSRLNFNKFKQDQLANATDELLYKNAKLQDPVTASNYKSSYFYDQVKGLYNKYRQAVYDQYNRSYDPNNLGPKSPRKLRADIEGKFSGNKGGEYHSPLMTMNFDFNNPFVIADEIEENKETGEVTLKRGSQVMDEGVKEVANLFKLAQSQPNDVIIDVGGVKEEVPGESWSRGQEAIQSVITELMTNHKKGNALIPKGSITFQGIVGGEDKYHAYHVKLAPTFFGNRKFSGKDKLGKVDGGDEPNTELINNGFTIYVPSEVSSKNMTFAKKYKSATTISPAEGMLNWANEIPIEIPEGGKIHLIKDAKTGEITMNSYGVMLNPNTRSFDTIRIKSENNKFGADAGTDLDAVIKRNMEIIKSVWFTNQKQKALLATPGQIGNQ